MKQGIDGSENWHYAWVQALKKHSKGREDCQGTTNNGILLIKQEFKLNRFDYENSKILQCFSNDDAQIIGIITEKSLEWKITSRYLCPLPSGKLSTSVPLSGDS